MCAASNLMSVVFCVLLLFVPFFNSFAEHYYNDYENFHSNYIPVISVEGNYILMSEFKNEIIIKQGETLEILCTSEKSDKLELYSVSGKSILNSLSVESINKTTIKYITTPNVTGMEFRCKEFGSTLYSTMSLFTDGPPDVKKFHCILNRKFTLVCTWSTTNKKGNFSLYMIEDQASIICQTNINIYEYDFTCTRKKALKYSERFESSPATLHLLMEYCSYTYCLNKTYDYNHLSIVKIDPPDIISISRYRNGGENSVFLSFKILDTTFNLFIDMEYKFEYVMFGSRPRQVYPFLIYVSNNGGYVIESTVAFDLPCSGRKYDVMVSVKTSQALDDRYWSDVATVSYTTPINKTINSYDDATCLEEEIEETPQIMVRELRRFKAKFREEQLELKSQIKELKTRVVQKIEK